MPIVLKSRILSSAGKVPFYGWPILLLGLCQDAPFFWDTVQLASKHAHHFFENSLRWSVLPPEIDSGHPPVFGWYLAWVWHFFGKSLAASHWAMLPFCLGIVWLLLKIGEKLGGEAWQFWLLPLVLLDPVLTGQMALVSPDVALAFFFLLALEAVLSENKQFQLVIAILGLCLISMRGMMTAGGIFLFCLISRDFRRLPFFLPGFFAAGIFLVWHFWQTGWVGFHSNSPWAPAFQSVGFQGFMRNLLVLGWRWLDFGRVFETLILVALFWKFFKIAPFFRTQEGIRGRDFGFFALPRMTIQTDGETRQNQIFKLFICLCLTLLPSTLIYQNLSAHRYFLPLFLLAHFIVFQWFVKFELSEFLKKWLLVGAIVFLASGNFWKTPIGISMDWDSTLGHLPYHELRREMLVFLDSQNIDFQEVGTEFPNINSGEDLELNGDQRRFAEKDFNKNRYVLWSNVFNDFSGEEFFELEKKWVALKKLERNGVCLHLYQKVE